MNLANSRAARVFSGLALVCGTAAGAAALPSDWQHEQQFDAPAPGLIKLSLPVATLNAARPALEDLRLYDDAGKEMPYLIERPTAAPKIAQNAKSFQVSLNARATVLMLETGLAQPLDGVTLETPATSFIKSVQIETSADGNRWEILARGKPIFRQPNGASQLHLDIPAGTLPWLRLTVDDQRSEPIPFTGASIHAAASQPVPGESLPVTITDRQESPGETRLTLNLGAANLSLATLHLETPEPLFTREVTVTAPQISEDSIREQILAGGVIYRVAVEGQPAAAQLFVPVESQVRSRELLLLIRNHDSPPLPITAVGGERRPVYLVFLARQAGAHHLLTGNTQCAAPHFDLAALGANLKSIAPSPIELSPLADNPSYRLPEVLPDVQATGVALDVSAWKFRKTVKLTRAGAQQLELDPDVLSRAQRDFQDLRLLRGGRQVSYIIERTSISRALTPVVAAAGDSKNPRLSRWRIKLPRPALPVLRLVCAARTPLFQREMTLDEELADERGAPYRRTLGQASWIQTPGRAGREFLLTLDNPPRSDTLFLETENGDNPPVELENFRLFYPATRVLFKAGLNDGPLLYYGNARAAAPRYDLSLVANELLAADKTAATLGAEEQLQKSSWRENQIPGKGGVLFWAVLALVVVVLLAIISRLLPKSAPPGSQI
jgi:hypothetical protein